MSRSARTELRGGVEGQLEEMYRDLAVQVKRMGQLQAQAGELRAAFRRLEGMASNRARRSFAVWTA